MTFVLAPGTRVGPYELLGALGVGGMGMVFRARDARLGRDVALKVLPDELNGDPSRLRRFEEEARTTSSLNHPNILVVFDVGESEGSPYLVTELLEGSTLRARLAGGPVPFRKALEWTAQVARGLAAAHGRGVLHRDLKPENLFVTRDGTVKILDFGIAKVLTPVADSTLSGTGPGAILGTAGYMAPEQVRGEPANVRSDIFALGAVLHELLAGKPAFGGPTAAERGYATLNSDPPSLSQTANPIPPAVERVVRRCLEKAPEERFQSALDLAFSLEALAESPSGPVAAVGGEIPRKRLRSLVLVGGAVVLAVTAFTAGYWRRAAHPHPSAPYAPRKLTRLTREPGIEWNPRIAPDGTWVVFSAPADPAGHTVHLFRQRIRGTAWTDLTPSSTRHAGQPAISPDGDHIAFRSGGALATFGSSEEEGSGIYVMDATGESVRRVTDFGFHPAWSPDGKAVLLTTQAIWNPAERDARSDAWVVDVESGLKRKLELGRDAIQGAWSPHDRRLAFCSGAVGGSLKRELFTVDLAGSAPKTLVDAGDRNIWNPTWSPDGRYLYYSSSSSGAFNIERVAVDEATGERLSDPESVTRGLGSFYFPSLSGDGTRLVFASLQRSDNIERVPLDARGEVAGPPNPVTRGSANYFRQPDVSPDGQQLVFTSALSPADVDENIFISRIDGSGLRALTHDVARRNRLPRWTRDGRRIVFHSNRSGGEYSVWSIAPDGSELRNLGPVPTMQQFVPSRTDDRAAALAEGEPVLIDTRPPLVNEPPQRLPSYERGPFYPFDWSADGKLLAGTVFSDFSIVVFSVESHSYARLATGREPRWLPDGKGLVYADWSGLSRLDLGSHARTPFVSNRTDSDSANECAFSPDGRWLYFAHGFAESDLWLMEL